MKKIILILACSFLTQQVFAQKRECVNEEFNLLSQMAKSAGYEWPGTLKTCTADENPGFAIYWSGPATGGAMNATLMGNPNRMQFTRGGSIRLFCMQVVGGQWVATGKDCP
jgi:hypothetical protein